MKPLFPLLFLMVVTCSCQPQSLKERISGKWWMENVYEYDEDQTLKHNPEGNRWIELLDNDTFVSDGDPFGKNTGYWSVNEKTLTLFLDSDMEDDDSEWTITLENDQMSWVGIGHPRKENTRIVYRRD